ncbi:hypothetical protein [Caloramator australicus]|uniref:Uncharacterized protein n=1 Tax=Caloramator australicus RC3 TaxID=857293 RepID=I7LIE4_9CLOT|nr:hypothetical protein [Caloramator australicus]CCJ32872.1 hypothetical protein CAAU_0788 [Caloramator australicus RC3]
MQKELKIKIENLAMEITLRETAETGEDYVKAIPRALDKACKILKVDDKEFIKMFTT